MADLLQEELYELKTQFRVALRASTDTREELEGVQLELTTESKVHCERVTELERGFHSLDAWVDDIATETGNRRIAIMLTVEKARRVAAAASDESKGEGARGALEAGV